jgi:hypothetical protein
MMAFIIFMKRFIESIECLNECLHLGLPKPTGSKFDGLHLADLAKRYEPQSAWEKPQEF